MTRCAVVVRDGDISSSQMEEMMQEARKQISEVQEKMNGEKSRQASDLHKKLGERKKKRLEEQVW